MAVIQWDSGIHKAFWTVDFLSNDDSRTDVIQMVKEYVGIEYEINLSEKEKGWYYVTVKVGE